MLLFEKHESVGFVNTPGLTWSGLPLARVAVAQSSSLSLFTNRDAELEQRAMLLKRLAFTIYSSEVDQYQKYLPDIQGIHSPLSQVNGGEQFLFTS